MKIYFTTETDSFVGEFEKGMEPAHLKSFTLAEDASTFAPRYKLENNKLVDAYPDLTDEEVAVKLQEAQAAAAKKLEDDLAAQTTA